MVRFPSEGKELDQKLGDLEYELSVAVVDEYLKRLALNELNLIRQACKSLKTAIRTRNARHWKG